MNMVKLDMILEKSSAKAAMAEISMKQCLPKRHQQMGHHCCKAIYEKSIRSRLGHG
jgi:hypothetical protein